MYVIDPHPNSSRGPYFRGNATPPGWQEWWQGYVTSMDGYLPKPYVTGPSFNNNPIQPAQQIGVGSPLFQPRTFKERVAQARNLIKQRGITTTMLIDEMDNPYWCTYGYMPNCAYLIDTTGKVVFRQTWYLPLPAVPPGSPPPTISTKTMENAIRSLIGRPLY